VLGTFPERRQLSVHALPSGQDRVATVLIWRKGATSPKLAALKQLLSGTRPAKRTKKLQACSNPPNRTPRR
jgi:hypothetical protein